MLKETWREARDIVRRETVMTLSWLLAAMTSFYALPKISYIDFHVLSILFCLMLVVAGFKKLKVLDYLAVYVLTLCSSLRNITLSLAGITFISSMFVTNDVALLTFVPLAIVIGKRLQHDMAKVIILQTLAANLGSALTPMGNPQNLFLYAHYKMSAMDFMSTMAPLAVTAMIWLCLLIVGERDQRMKVELSLPVLGPKKVLLFYSSIFVVCLLAVFHLLDFRLAFCITFLGVFFNDRSLFRSIDYALLITFCGFFVFIGNISNFDFIQQLQKEWLNTAAGVYWLGIIMSQFVSNVPAAMLIAGFTPQAQPLLLGVDVGGLGTLIASMASVISYKLYLEANPTQGRNYLMMFLYYNFMGLLILAPVTYYLMIS
ncbi:MAG: SLC13 family permease [Acidaminococcaceae bacterium]